MWKIRKLYALMDKHFRESICAMWSRREQEESWDTLSSIVIAYVIMEHCRVRNERVLIAN